MPLDRGECILLAVEAQCRSGEAQPFHPGDLHDRTLWCQVALEHDEPAGRRQRLCRRVHDILPSREDHILQVFSDRLTGDRHAIAVQIAAVEQGLHQHRHAADIVQILHHVPSARLEIADIRGALADLAEIMQVELDAGLVGDRRQMQSAIGRAAGRGDDCRGVFERLAGDDVARPNVALDQFHHRPARGLRVGVARIVWRRRAGRARQCQPDRLGNAGHRVGGEETAARTRRGASGAFELVQFLVGHPADAVRADTLIDIANRHVAAMEAAGQDRAAIHENRRHVEPHHRHHQPGQRLVAPCQSDERVIAMAAHRQFDRVGDDLAADQRRLHPGMPHRDPVGDRDRRELTRRPARGRYALLRDLRLAGQRDVAGCGLVPGRRHAD